MTLSTFIKLVNKAIRWATIRPLQRFNVAARSVKYLGPSSKHFKPAPRAIGALSRHNGKAPQYPHLEGGGFVSMRVKRLEALKRAPQLPEVDNLEEEDQQKLPVKSFSENEEDDNLVKTFADKLEVLKTVVKLSPPLPHVKLSSPPLQIQGANPDHLEVKPQRPLPKMTSLNLTNLNVLWQVDKVPEGRLDLNALQEMMLNKLADQDGYWTAERIAERYKIKAEYADSLTNYLQQMKIVISPRFKTTLDYVCHKDPIYQATKDTLYEVDFTLRTQKDKQYDKTFLPEEEELDEQIKQMLTASSNSPSQLESSLENSLVEVSDQNHKPLPKPRRPEPLRLEPINKARARIQ